MCVQPSFAMAMLIPIYDCIYKAQTFFGTAWHKTTAILTSDKPYRGKDIAFRGCVKLISRILSNIYT